MMESTPTLLYNEDPNEVSLYFVLNSESNRMERVDMQNNHRDDHLTWQFTTLNYRPETYDKCKRIVLELVDRSLWDPSINSHKFWFGTIFLCELCTLMFQTETEIDNHLSAKHIPKAPADPRGSREHTQVQTTTVESTTVQQELQHRTNVIDLTLDSDEE